MQRDKVAEHFAQAMRDDPKIFKRQQEAVRAVEQAERIAGLTPGWQDEFIPKVLPVDYRIQIKLPDGANFLRNDGLSVIVSAALELDGRRWLHVSLARRNHLPSYKDVKEVKLLFVGRDRLAIQVFPPEREFVNHHLYALHLFACLEDGDKPLPDFTHGTGSI